MRIDAGRQLDSTEDQLSSSSKLGSVVDHDGSASKTRQTEKAPRTPAQSSPEWQDFVSRASHDLQGPLRNIVICSELLLRRHNSALDQNGQELLQLIADESKCGLALTKALFAYARALEGGFDPAPVQLEHVLRHALVKLKDSLEKAGAVVSSDPLPQIVGDNNQLEQVFQNLLDNAIRYRGTTAPVIHVSAVQRETNWIISVADNGTGIAERFKDRVFKPFERLHKQPVSGSGLGLATCKRIVEKHHGQIWVESTPDVGSTFFFSLPIKPAGPTLEQ